MTMIAPATAKAMGLGIRTETSASLEPLADAARKSSLAWLDVAHGIRSALPARTAPAAKAMSAALHAAEAARAAAMDADAYASGAHSAARRQLPAPTIALAVCGAAAASALASAAAHLADRAVTEALAARAADADRGDPGFSARPSWDAATLAHRTAAIAEQDAIRLGAIKPVPSDRGRCRSCGVDARGPRGRTIYYDKYDSAIYDPRTLDADTSSADVIKARICTVCHADAQRSDGGDSY